MTTRSTPALQEQADGSGTQLPPRGDVAARLVAEEPLDERDALHQDGFLLLHRHRDRILMGIAVETDLMAGLGHHRHFLGERLDGVAGDEPGRLDAMPLEQLQQARTPDLAGEQPARDVARRVLATICVSLSFGTPPRL